MRLSARMASFMMKKLIERIEDVINDEERVKHSALAKKILELSYEEDP